MGWINRRQLQDVSRKQETFAIILLFMSVAAISTLSPLGGFSSQVSPELFDSYERPENVIMIDIDTLRADHLGTYGYERETSPNIDRFAENNIKFENAVTPAAWTLPAAVSVFTGTYPRTHGIVRQRKKVPEGYTMIAEVMRSNGYRTAAFTGSRHMAEKLGFDQGFEVYRNDSDYRWNRKRNFQANFRNAADWLQNTSDEPSFVFIHGYDAHAPYGYHQEFLEDYAGNYSGPLKDRPPLYPGELEYDSGDLTLLRDNTSLDEKDIEYIRAGYDSDVRHIDREFGGFIDRLKEQDMYEDSAIIFYSSHGENLGDRVYRIGYEQEMFGHWYLWDHNIRVPLLVKLPGAGSRTVDDPVSLVDIAPTVYDLTDSELSDREYGQLQGRTLLPVIDGEESRSYAFSEAQGDSMIRGQDWKLIDRYEEEDVLYSLRPEERRMIENHTERYEQMHRRLEEWDQATPESMEEQLLRQKERTGLLDYLLDELG